MQQCRLRATQCKCANLLHVSLTGCHASHNRFHTPSTITLNFSCSLSHTIYMCMRPFLTVVVTCRFTDRISWGLLLWQAIYDSHLIPSKKHLADSLCTHQTTIKDDCRNTLNNIHPQDHILLGSLLLHKRTHNPPGVCRQQAMYLATVWPSPREVSISSHT